MVSRREASAVTSDVPDSWVTPSVHNRVSMAEGEFAAAQGAKLPGGIPDESTLARIRGQVSQGIGFELSPTGTDALDAPSTATESASEPQE